jgi:hypothetical protein
LNSLKKKKPRRFAVEKFTASRVCQVPEDPENFNIYTEMLCET